LGMGGIVGRLFREFAVTLSAAILVSMLISLTTTPAMCAWLLKGRTAREEEEERPAGRWRSFTRRFSLGLKRRQRRIMRGYRRSLAWSLRQAPIMVMVLLATIALNVVLYVTIKKGFFPQQDTGRMMVMVQADQSISFQAMREKLLKFMSIIQEDDAVATVTGFTSGGRGNSATMFVSLKPLGKGEGQRQLSADEVITRLRPKLSHEPGANAFIVASQD